jgi:hypothetical protein
MPQHQGQFRFIQFTIHDMQIGVADTAGVDFKQYLFSPWLRDGQIGQF